MNNKLNNLILRHSSDFKSICDGINEYIKVSNSNIQKLTDENRSILINCVNGLTKVAEYSIEYGNYKDTWDYGSFYEYIYGPELIVKSLKTNCDYRIGMEENGIYLSFELSYNSNLRYMDDGFWKKLLELTEFDGFKYSEYEFTSDKQRKQFPELFKTNKSMIYKIMRKYFFSVINSDYNYRSSSVGEFQITCDSAPIKPDNICRVR